MIEVVNPSILNKMSYKKHMLHIDKKKNDQL